MRRCTCSKLQGLMFYFEFEVRMSPLEFSYCYFWGVHVSYEAESHQITETGFFPSGSL